MFLNILKISFRNIIRQRRRSILLGIAIAFGAMILIVANSFSRGISHVLFNEIIVYLSGHVSLNFSERGNYSCPIFYDKNFINDLINETVPELKSKEEGVGVFARAIGKGKSDNIFLVGYNFNAQVSNKQSKKVKQNFKIIKGSFNNLRDTIKENPVVLSQAKAEYLNVTIDDIIKARFKNVLGQSQAVRLTVVGIFEPTNMFMSIPVFLEFTRLKKIMDYGPNHNSNFNITIKNPKVNASLVANSLHAKLKPAIAYIPAQISHNNNSSIIPILGFKDDSVSLTQLDSLLVFHNGTLARNSVLINTIFKEKYSLTIGDTINFTRICKHDSLPHPASLIINGVVTMQQCTTATILINPSDFYRLYYSKWPVEDISLQKHSIISNKSHPFASVVTPQWELMKRSHSKDEHEQFSRKIRKLKTKAVIVDVRSMYETASDVLKLERALNLITVIAVLVIFFIILIGVINTLRLIVKERTREIGTMRAIGMQRHHVRALFMIEAALLSFFASITGTILSFLIMAILKIITFDGSDNPLSMLLVSNHLYFAPSFILITIFNILIWCITIITAWGPAQRAANMHPSQALGHFE